MIKKLIVSAVVLTALIVGKESRAAGVGGFARVLSEHTAIERFEGAGTDATLTFSERRELLQVNSAVNSSISELDSYFDTVTGVPYAKIRADACLDCADLKRDHLISLGWSPQALRIEYAIGGEGRIERVLVISTESGDVILGHGSAIDMPGDQAERGAPERHPAIPAYHHI